MYAKGKRMPESPTLEKLNTQQETLLQEFAAHCLLLEKSERPNKIAVEDAIARRYQALKLVPPPVVWAESPWQLICLQGVLSLLTCAQKEEVLSLLKANLKSPLWRRLWVRLDQ